MYCHSNTQKWVPKKAWTAEVLRVTGILGNTQPLPLAQVRVLVNGVQQDMTVAINGRSYDALLRLDTTYIRQLLTVNSEKKKKERPRRSCPWLETYADPQDDIQDSDDSGPEEKRSEDSQENIVIVYDQLLEQRED